MANFGRTWWGQQWLSAFAGIDLSNRLPRGRRYANNGSVQGLTVDSDGGKARVWGSRSKPYQVRVTLPHFSRTDRDVIMATASNSPVLLSRLLGRQLPPHVLDLLKQRDVSLFPHAWHDLDARCSCPDFALPCKHIAAVIYLIANEIDKNPFVIFTLRGLDLPAQLAERTGVQPAALDSLPALDEAWHTNVAGDETDNSELLSTHAALARIDLSCVPALEARLFTILTAEPLFHAKDFRAVLAKQYKRARRVARAFDRQNDDTAATVEHLSNVSAVVDSNGALVAMHSDGQALFKAAQRRDDANSFEAFLSGLQAIAAEREPRLAPTLAFWRLLLRVALKLIEQGAVVPWVGSNSLQQTIVHWQPARLDAIVDSLMTQLAGLCPPQLVQMESQSGRRRTFWSADASTQVLTALHILLAHFMRRGFEITAESRGDDVIKQLFFTGRPVHFDSFETRETPRLISHWLRRLGLSERAHRLRLIVTEQGEDETLGVALAVEREQGFEPIADWLARADSGEGKAAVLAGLAILADYYPDVEQLYAAESGAQAHEDELVYTLAEFTPVMRDVLPVLRMLGIGVILPKALRNVARPQASLSLSSTNADADVSYLDLDQLLQFDWQVAIGDQNLSVDEFRQLLANASGLVRLKGEYVMVDAAETRRLLDKLEQPPEELSRAQLLQAGLAGELDGAVVSQDEDARQLFDRLIQPQSLPPAPANLDARLRPYQQRGFEWLAENARLGFGSLLADDMGLGKTLQLIALLAHLQATQQLDGPGALIVVPTPLLTNWRHEIERFAPTLAVQVYHGADRKLEENSHDVVVTSYGLVRLDAKTLAKPRWCLLAIDEAQNIKNPATAQTKAIKRLKAGIKVALSGTPVENRLREYWSVFDFTNPKYLGTQKRFAEHVATPIERDRDQHALDQFRAVTAPFILRRLKTDKAIIADLPDKIEANRYCSLSAEQASLYQSTVDSIMEELADSGEGVERRGTIFKLLNALKQICNSPAQFLERETADPQASGKLATFIDLLREADAVDEKALIFTQYTTMGCLLAASLYDQLGFNVPFLHGGLTRQQRDAMVAAFQGEGGPRALIVSLKAGGTGLNLTAASQVIHYDLWWNPAVETQATDRAYRIGQRRNVTVHRLITENTFEEKIDAMIQSKKELADLTVASGEQWISELSDNELRELVQL